LAAIRQKLLFSPLESGIKKKKKGVWKAFRFLGFTFIGLVFLGVVLSWVIQIPSVQRQLVFSAGSFAERFLGARVEIGEVGVDFPAYFDLQDVNLYDEYGEVLACATSIRLRLFSLDLWRMLFRPRQQQYLSMRGAVLVSPSVYIYRRSADGKLNTDFLSSEKSDTSSPDTTLNINLERIEIWSAQVTYVDSTDQNWERVSPGKVNFQHIEAGAITGFFSFEMAPLGRIRLGVYDLSFREYCSGLSVERLETCIRLDSITPDEGRPMRFVEVSPLMLDAGATHLSGMATFPDATLATLFDEWGNDFFYAGFDASSIDFSLAEFFLPDTLPVKGVVRFQGLVEGQFKKFKSSHFEVAFGEQSHLVAAFELSDLSSISKAYLDIVAPDAVVSPRDLARLIPSTFLPENIQELNPVSLSGSYEGGYSDFQTRASLVTSEGGADLSLHMAFPAGLPPTYEGSFGATGLNLEALGLKRGFVSKRLNARGKIIGKGFNIRDLDTRLDVQVVASNLYGFEIDSIYGLVLARQKKISGALATRDSSGRASVQMDMDLGATPRRYQLDGRVAGLNLRRYQLYPDPVEVSSRMRIDLTGNSLDELAGDVRLMQFSMENRRTGQVVKAPSFVLKARNGASNEKTYALESNFINLDLQGRFKIEKALEQVQRLGAETRLFLSNNDSAIQAYYAQKKPETSELSLTLGVSVQDSLNSLLEFFNLPLFIPSGVWADANFEFSAFDQANVSLHWDTLAVAGVGLKNGNTEFQLFKNSLQNNLVLTGGLMSERLIPTDKLILTDVSLDMQGTQDSIETDIVADQLDSDNSLRVKLKTMFQDNGVIVAYLDSASSLLLFNNDSLRVNHDHRVRYDQKDVLVEHAVIRSGNRFLRLDGFISEDPAKSLNLQLSRFDLTVLNDVADIGYQIGGRANANVDVYALQKDARVDGYCRVDGFEVNEFEYGSIFLTTRWQQSSEELSLRANLVNRRDTTLSLSGRYSFRDKESPVRFNIRSEKGFPLNYIEPFVESQLYGIKGTVALDRFVISGTLDDLQVNGTGELVNAGCGVDYLKTEYTFNGLIQFDNNRITLPRLTLYDRERHSAQFHGVIRHRGLREFVFDLQLDELDNFLLMDTKKGDNELFYGTVYLKNGVGSLTGDLSRLNVQAFVTTGAKTLFKIPLMEYVEDSGIPGFVAFKGDEKNKTHTVSADYAGFELNLTVMATEESRVELIFDDRVGDIIKGNGEGVISFNVTAEGDFTMFGDYTIQGGDYLFTSQNILNKKFLVRQGGRISWSGDPYDAQVRLDATYPVNADIKALMPGSSESVRVPVNVLMHMEGSLMQPTISLSIEIPNLDNQTAATIVSYLRSIQYDEQELNKQVFSLMVFSRFAPIGGLGLGDSGAGVTTSISELLSNQLNYWLGQAMNDNVNVNFGTSNFQDVNLLVSAKLFNDRVTLERNGALVGANSPLTLGNISIIIKLLPKAGQEQSLAYPRELVLEVFNRENLTDNLLRDNRTGMGVFYKIDFDNLYDLLRKEAKKGM
jgi:hypothetical protein